MSKINGTTYYKVNAQEDGGGYLKKKKREGPLGTLPPRNGNCIVGLQYPEKQLKETHNEK